MLKKKIDNIVAFLAIVSSTVAALSCITGGNIQEKLWFLLPVSVLFIFLPLFSCAEYYLEDKNIEQNIEKRNQLLNPLMLERNKLVLEQKLPVQNLKKIKKIKI